MQRIFFLAYENGKKINFFSFSGKYGSIRLFCEENPAETSGGNLLSVQSIRQIGHNGVPPDRSMYFDRRAAHAYKIAW
jgi:hypothetical protein